jgi:hypothetical protein
MVTLHIVICFVALLAGALVLIALCGGKHQPTWAAVLPLTPQLRKIIGLPSAMSPSSESQVRSSRLDQAVSDRDEGQLGLI